MEGGSGGIAAALRQMQEQPGRRSYAGRRLDLVRGERLKRELGDARLRARKEEHAGAKGDDRRRA
jgi:hypothetical protein